ncbi:histidine kinase [Lederbergia graminis]|uniref:histidine kinase n=1 Tax=Lederbergia graminis TaxID=735518 RepID=A0ABW0LKW3_9BACI
MFSKIYPSDQIRRYLILDVAGIIFLFSFVLSTNHTMNLFYKLLLLILFLGSFYISLWHRDWLLLMGVTIGYGSLAILAYFFGPSLLLFGFFFADLLGRANKRKIIAIGIPIMAIFATFVIWQGEGSYFTVENPALLPILIVQLLYPILIHIRMKAINLQTELDAANEQIEQYIQEEERHRIARDLHDTLGQTLTMIKLKSELTTRLIDKDPKLAKQELNDILGTARIALKQVRELVTDMKFVSLESEIENAQKLLGTAGIDVVVERKGQIHVLSSVDETMLALAVREAVTNVMKHSQAQECKLVLQAINESYTVTIQDDGIGLFHKNRGNGIQSMRERMQAIQGTMDVDNVPDGGTIVTLSVPIYLRKENPVL